MTIRRPIRLLHKIGRVLSYWRMLSLKMQVRLYGAQLKIGRNVHFGHSVRFQGHGTLILEDGVTLGHHLGGATNQPILLQPREEGSVIYVEVGSWLMNGCELISRSSIHIGKHCLIGPKCTFLDSDFHGLKPSERMQAGFTKPIVLGRNVWLGNEVMVLKGVKIGDDAVIGARTVLTKDVSAGATVVGSPTRVVGSVY